MKNILLYSALVLTSAVHAQTVIMSDAKTGQPSGKIEISTSKYGVIFTPSLSGLEPGGHGFHVHENPSCDSTTENGKKVAAGAAGSHYDPDRTRQHGFPWSDNSHLGDLPLLFVDNNGKAVTPVLAPRLKSEDLSGRALMIHAGSDNYSDTPEKLGGGGARVLCGVIKSAR